MCHTAWTCAVGNSVYVSVKRKSSALEVLQQSRPRRGKPINITKYLIRKQVYGTLPSAAFFSVWRSPVAASRLLPRDLPSWFQGKAQGFAMLRMSVRAPVFSGEKKVMKLNVQAKSLNP
ncbi:unnamed protein product [Discosporangium mesarthrocarpum]